MSKEDNSGVGFGIAFPTEVSVTPSGTKVEVQFIATTTKIIEELEQRVSEVYGSPVEEKKGGNRSFFGPANNWYTNWEPTGPRPNWRVNPPEDISTN